MRKSSAQPRRARKSIAKKLVLISGASGKMGMELRHQLGESRWLKLGACVDASEIRAVDDGHTAVMKKSRSALAVMTDAVDVIVDFSSPAGTREILDALSKSRDKMVLIGTTGLSSKDIIKIKNTAKKGSHRILLAGNTSLGIATLVRACLLFAKSLAGAGFDIEITEAHHNRKADAPSGTALLLARALQGVLPGYKIAFNRPGKRAPDSIGIHSVRGGGIVGEHEIRFISDFEEVSFRHRAFSRSLFAAGAISLLSRIENKIKSGSMMTFEELISSEF